MVIPEINLGGPTPDHTTDWIDFTDPAIQWPSDRATECVVGISAVKGGNPTSVTLVCEMSMEESGDAAYRFAEGRWTALTYTAESNVELVPVTFLPRRMRFKITTVGTSMVAWWIVNLRVDLVRPG
jgi:hypothetical protein